MVERPRGGIATVRGFIGASGIYVLYKIYDAIAARISPQSPVVTGPPVVPVGAPTPWWDKSLSAPVWIVALAFAVGLIVAFWPSVLRYAYIIFEWGKQRLEPREFYYQVRNLAARLRVLAVAWDKGEPSLEGFKSDVARWTRIQPRYWAIKKRLEKIVGVNHPVMHDLTITFPIASDGYRKMAELLEQLANEVPAGTRSIPIPKADSDSA